LLGIKSATQTAGEQVAPEATYTDCEEVVQDLLWEDEVPVNVELLFKRKQVNNEA